MVQEDGTMKVLQRMDYPIKRVFSKQIGLHSCTIEEANQEVHQDQEDHHRASSNQASQSRIHARQNHTSSHTSNA